MRRTGCPGRIGTGAQVFRNTHLQLREHARVAITCPGDDARAIDDVGHGRYACGVPLRPEFTGRVGEDDERQVQTIGPDAGIGGGRRPAGRVLCDDTDRREPLRSEVDVELVDTLDQGLRTARSVWV